MIAPLFACLVSASAFATPPSLALYIDHVARANGVPVEIALSVRWQESRGDPFATRHNSNGTTDEGPWQLNSETIKWLAVRFNRGRPINPYNRYESARIAIMYLGALYTVFGDWRDVLTAYNAGPRSVTRRIIPESTTVYVEQIAYRAGM